MADFKNAADVQNTIKIQKTGLPAAVVAENLKKALERFDGAQDVRVETSRRTDGAEIPLTSESLWVTTPYDLFIEVVEALFGMDALHFHVISGFDDGDAVTLRYHFSLFSYAGRNERVGVSVIVRVPKSNLVMPSLFPLIPGIEFSERESREMYGVEFDGLPNKALVFLPDQWDEEIKPWRDDEAGLSQKPDTVRRLS